MTATDHGPGVAWLAQRHGTTPEELLRDPIGLIEALAAAVRDGVDLAARLGSDDPSARARAEAEARAVRAHFVSADGPTPGERFASTVAQGLREAAERAKARGADGRYGGPPARSTRPANP